MHNAVEGGWKAYIVISLALAVNQDLNTRYKIIYSGEQPSSSPLPRDLSKHLRVHYQWVGMSDKSARIGEILLAGVLVVRFTHGVTQFAAGDRGITMSK